MALVRFAIVLLFGLIPAIYLACVATFLFVQVGSQPSVPFTYYVWGLLRMIVGITAAWALGVALVRRPSRVLRLAMATGLLLSIQGLVLLPRVLEVGFENLASLVPISSLMVLAVGGSYLARVNEGLWTRTQLTNSS